MIVACVGKGVATSGFDFMFAIVGIGLRGGEGVEKGLGGAAKNFLKSLS